MRRTHTCGDGNVGYAHNNLHVAPARTRTQTPPNHQTPMTMPHNMYSQWVTKYVKTLLG